MLGVLAFGRCARKHQVSDDISDVASCNCWEMARYEEAEESSSSLAAHLPKLLLGMLAFGRCARKHQVSDDISDVASCNCWEMARYEEAEENSSSLAAHLPKLVLGVLAFGRCARKHQVSDDISDVASCNCWEMARYEEAEESSSSLAAHLPKLVLGVLAFGRCARKHQVSDDISDVASCNCWEMARYEEAEENSSSLAAHLPKLVLVVLAFGRCARKHQVSDDISDVASCNCWEMARYEEAEENSSSLAVHLPKSVLGVLAFGRCARKHQVSDDISDVASCNCWEMVRYEEAEENSSSLSAHLPKLVLGVLAVGRCARKHQVSDDISDVASCNCWEMARYEEAEENSSSLAVHLPKWVLGVLAFGRCARKHQVSDDISDVASCNCWEMVRYEEAEENSSSLAAHLPKLVLGMLAFGRCARKHQVSDDISDVASCNCWEMARYEEAEESSSSLAAHLPKLVLGMLAFGMGGAQGSTRSVMTSVMLLHVIAGRWRDTKRQKRVPHLWLRTSQNWCLSCLHLGGAQGTTRSVMTSVMLLHFM